MRIININGTNNTVSKLIGIHVTLVAFVMTANNGASIISQIRT